MSENLMNMTFLKIIYTALFRPSFGYVALVVSLNGLLHSKIQNSEFEPDSDLIAPCSTPPLRSRNFWAAQRPRALGVDALGWSRARGGAIRSMGDAGSRLSVKMFRCFGVRFNILEVVF